MGMRGRVWYLILAAVLAPACQLGAEAPNGDALAESESATGDSAAAQEPLTVVIDTTNDDRSVAARLQDMSIAANVRMRLVDEANVNINQVSTIVDNGQVLLQGEVASAAQRQQAEQLAGQVDGVRQVVNRLSAPDAPPVADEPVQPDTTAVQPQTTPPSGAQPQVQQTPPAQPPPQTQTPPQPQAPAEQYHTVASGDNLWTISRRYSTSIEQIRSLNSLASDNLRPGQRLRVK
jgi:LysM repeat protein